MTERLKQIKKLEARLSRALAGERHSIARGLSRLKKGSAKDDKWLSRLEKLEKRLVDSIRRRQWRENNRPDPVYDSGLPIMDKKDRIIEAIRNHPVVIVSGETGSGKSTQLPMFCLAAGRGGEGLIGCTQPRRIAATAISGRVAEQFGEASGGNVGYKIRFTDRTRKNSFIKFMTDGILLAESQRDRMLWAYDTLVIDEAHERSLNIDFILGMLRTLVKRRPELKLIITSATIDTEKFAGAFDDAPVIHVSGRLYPVAVRYRPLGNGSGESDPSDPVEAAVDAVDQLQGKDPFGDILVFMPTEQDIRDTCEAILGRKYPGVSVLPLFSRLSAREQGRVFGGTSGRKIIVSTNVAETSITIPGIKYVVDTGLARISRYSARTRTTSLPVEPVSKSSADQRMGRCGRVQNGVCIRLFSEDDYLARPRFTPPEIRRANLAEVILRMLALNIRDVENFPFIDRPDPRSVKDGIDLLMELGAVRPVSDPKGGRKRLEMTSTGRLMARMPIDPRLSKMLLTSRKENCVREVLVLAAALSIQDPKERPSEKTDEADVAHARFNDPRSDFISLLNIWNRYQKEKAGTTGAVRRFCRTAFLSFRRMREWTDIHQQLIRILGESGFSLPKNIHEREVEIVAEGGEKIYGAVHRSILSGFLSNIGSKKEGNIFRAAKGKEVMIFPGSGLFNKAGGWIVAAEMVATSRLFARTVGKIEVGWLETIGGELCRRTYKAPRWDRKRGAVVASEQISLFGLIIVDGRTMPFGPVDPMLATRIFIESALVRGELDAEFPFLIHNLGLAETIRKLEDQSRRRDLLVGESQRVKFYEKRLGQIYDVRSLAASIRKRGDDRYLKMTRKDLILQEPDPEHFDRYPEAIELGGHTFNCEYRYEPGHKADGVTLRIPEPLVTAVSEKDAEWGVPGMLREKILSLIKTLPKEYRKRLFPVAEVVDIILQGMPVGQEALPSALSRFIFERFGVDIPASAWQAELLPEHLRMRYAVVDFSGETVRTGRNIGRLQEDSEKTREPEAVQSVRRQWERKGLATWDFNDLPPSIEIESSGSRQWVLYPGLHKAGEKGKGAEVRLFENPEIALSRHCAGVGELLKIHLEGNLKFLRRQLLLPAELAEIARWFGGKRLLDERIRNFLERRLFNKNIRSREEFFRYADQVRQRTADEAGILMETLVPLLTGYGDVRNRLEETLRSNIGNRSISQFLENREKDLNNLIPNNFLDLYPMERFRDLQRFLKGLGIRIEKGAAHLERDRLREERFQIYADDLHGLLAELGPDTTGEKRAAVEDFFWLVEEFRLSIFAQELKAGVPVSEKRLKQRLAEIRRMI